SRDVPGLYRQRRHGKLRRLNGLTWLESTSVSCACSVHLRPIAAAFVVDQGAPFLDAVVLLIGPGEAGETAEQVRRVIADARTVAEDVGSGVESSGRALHVPRLYGEPRLREERMLLRFRLLHAEPLNFSEQRAGRVE